MPHTTQQLPTSSPPTLHRLTHLHHQPPYPSIHLMHTRCHTNGHVLAPTNTPGRSVYPLNSSALRLYTAQGYKTDVHLPPPSHLKTGSPTAHTQVATRHGYLVHCRRIARHHNGYVDSYHKVHPTPLPPLTTHGPTANTQLATAPRYKGVLA